jgi:hypothetical protein
MKMISMLDTEPIDAAASEWLIALVHDNATHGYYGAMVILLHLLTHIFNNHTASFTAAI